MPHQSDTPSGRVFLFSRMDGFTGTYSVSLMCELIHAETAEVLAEYREDFYQGYPALTVNRFGDGEVYYMAARAEPPFLDGFYMALAACCGLSRALQADWAEGVNAQVRTDGVRDYIFLHNFTDQEQILTFKESVRDLDGAPVEAYFRLPAYGYSVFIRSGNGCSSGQSS